MHPILLAKVTAWAAASDGCFPVAGHNKNGQVQVAKYDGSARFKWAKVGYPTHWPKLQEFCLLADFKALSLALLNCHIVV